jgi:hypothetical protein
MRITFWIAIILLTTSTTTFSQALTWRDTYNCDYMKINIDHDLPIDCNDFFKLADSCLIDDLITWNWTSLPGVINLDSVLTLIHYPNSAIPFQINGKVYVRFLIDKEGKVYCYKILTELGDVFIKVELQHFSGQIIKPHFLFVII